MTSSAGTQVVLSGLGLGESPRWHSGQLWFSDWLGHEIATLGPGGTRNVIHEIPGIPFCFDWDVDDRLLVVCNDGGRRLLRQTVDGSLSTFADLAIVMDKPWNEIVVDGQGRAFVNCIGFDMMSGESPAPGIIALVGPDGRARQVAEGLEFPNGMVVTPTNTLIVAESHAQRLTAFDIGRDGELTNRRIWAEVDGYPDGLSLDSEGKIWCAAMTTCIRIAEGGHVLQRVDLDRSAFACAIGGDANARELFIMAAVWDGPEGMSSGARTGQVVSVPVEALPGTPYPSTPGPAA